MFIINRIELTLNSLLREARKITVQIDDMIQKFKVATDAAAINWANLVATLKAQKGELTPEQEAAFNEQLAHEQALGTDPSNPVPPSPGVIPTPSPAGTDHF